MSSDVGADRKPSISTTVAGRVFFEFRLLQWTLTVRMSVLAASEFLNFSVPVLPYFDTSRTIGCSSLLLTMGVGAPIAVSAVAVVPVFAQFHSKFEAVVAKVSGFTTTHAHDLVGVSSDVQSARCPQ